VSERQYLDITDTRVAALGSLLVEAARAGRVMDLSDQSGGQHLTGTVVVFSQGLPSSVALSVAMWIRDNCDASGETEHALAARTVLRNLASRLKV
jgi:predicted aconitase with swiveling domain